MGYTRFTKVAAEIFKGLQEGVAISKGANYTLADEEKVFYIGLTASAASKTFTLDLPEGSVCVVVNEGSSNAFTLKNVSGDSGTTVAAGACWLVRASRTANGSVLVALYLPML